MSDSHINEDPKLTEDEEHFELYAVHNFNLVYNKFIEGNKHVTCYYCNYISKHTILRNIQGELNHHITNNHQGILETFDPDTYMIMMIMKTFSCFLLTHTSFKFVTCGLWKTGLADGINLLLISY